MHRDRVDPAADLVHSLPIRISAALIGLTLMGVVAIGVSGLRAPSEWVSAPPAMFSVAPGGVVDPADVPVAIQVLYRGAHAHPDMYEAVPCFCGCEATLEHRHLFDCFSRADGAWEAHALGCGVCLGEAAQVEELLASGETDPMVVRAAIVATWSDPYR
jgi:hypothetical protein